MSVQVGDKLGEYRILTRIGGGACGEVFEAEHEITRRRDAIKVLADERLHIPEEEQRFLREIQVQASLHHVNIAEVYNAFQTPYGPALVMELVRGVPLNAILARGRVPLRRGISYVLGMLAGLSYAHTKGVVHRDIKPENVIVAPDDSIKLTDFGLARSLASPRLTQSGVFVGSPCYMSPEQGLGVDPIDSRSDIYSAGVVLYEIVTGRLPFKADTSYAVMAAHQNAPLKPPIELCPRIGAELNQVIVRALQKIPARRFESAAAFHTALEKVAVTISPTRGAAPPASPLPKRVLLAVGGCSILAAGVYSVIHQMPRLGSADRDAPAKHEFRAIKPPTAPNPGGLDRQVSPEASVAPAPDSAGDDSTQLPVAGTARRAKRRKPTGLRITGVTRQEPSPPVRPRIRVIKPAESPVASIPEAPAAPAPITNTAPEVKPLAPAVKSGAGTIPAPPASAITESAPVPEKKRNVVVRTFQRVFHPSRKAAESARGPHANDVKGTTSASRPDTVKQQP